MPRKNGGGPPEGARGPRNGSGGGQGRASGGGTGAQTGGRKGTCVTRKVKK